MGIKNLLLWRVIPTLVLIVAVFIGWLSSHELPLGVFFATIIPIMKGFLPPTIAGHGKMSGTPEVPTDLLPQSRPETELFLELPGGHRMPMNGLGMCCRPSAYDDVLVYRTVLWYLLLGGRHIDGAHLYLNHKAIGRGIQEAIRRGVDRNEIFVTTKIFPTQFGYQSTLDNILTYLQDLGLEYVDLVLLHFPSAPASFLSSSDCKQDGPSLCRRQTWKALSELRLQGKIRNAGVSNFAKKHLLDLKGVELEGVASVPVANNQIQFNPFEPEHVMETVEYCMQHNITITAYSPLGGLMDRDKAFANELLSKISVQYQKTTSQVMLRWAIQRGFAVIPGTGNPNHQQENLHGVYEFELSKDDMDLINELKYTAQGFTHLDTRNAD